MKLARRRRKENKTNYTKRIKMLKSEKPRVAFRITNKYVIAQYIVSHEAQDKVELTVNSKNLLKLGWPKEFEGSLKSIPAAYLTGYLIGKRINKGKKENPIVDLGMLRTIYKTKVYAFIKGLIDSDLEISCKNEAFPEEERIQGKSLKKDFSKYFETIKLKINSI
jgi:large subunit ribosomal protein L18